MSSGGGTAMEKAIQLASKATDADKAKNFSEAMVLYQSSVQYFLHSIKYDAHSDKTKITLRKKCEEYLTRAEELGKYTEKKKAVSEGGHTKKKVEVVGMGMMDQMMKMKR